jgi:leucyl aminopeptidase
VNTIRELTAAGAQLDAALGAYLSRLIQRGDVRGKPGETALVTSTVPFAHVLVIGLRRKDASGKQYRKAVQTAVSF